MNQTPVKKNKRKISKSISNLTLIKKMFRHRFLPDVVSIDMSEIVQSVTNVVATTWYEAKLERYENSRTNTQRRRHKARAEERLIV